MATRITIISLLTIFLLLPTTLKAKEIRCQDLGANCTCSSTLNTSTWNHEGSGWWWPAEDNNTRCSDVTVNGQRVNWLETAPIAVPETGMPAGNTVDHVVRFDNRSGQMIIAGVPPQHIGRTSGRVCMRYYFKVSSNYQTTNDPGCDNDKWIQMGDYIGAFNSGFSNSANGGGFWPNRVPIDFANKWGRFEYCVDNFANPKQYEAYLKNITDDTPESTMTFAPRLGQGGIGEGGFWIINGYRQGSCSGYREISHAMLAVWPTNQGQRIGPALEIEGNLSPDTTPPAAPTGLKILSWLDKWLLAALRPSYAQALNFNLVKASDVASSCDDPSR